MTATNVCFQISVVYGVVPPNCSAHTYIVHSNIVVTIYTTLKLLLAHKVASSHDT